MVTKKEILLEMIYMPIKNRENFMNSIQIMQSMFLLNQDKVLSKFYKFQPYLYGACSFEIYLDLMELEYKGFIDSIYTEQMGECYRITKKGIEEVKKYEKNLDKDIITKIYEKKEIVLSKSFLELFEYIYTKYPEYAKNSIINIETFKK